MNGRLSRCCPPLLAPLTALLLLTSACDDDTPAPADQGVDADGGAPADSGSDAAKLTHGLLGRHSALAVTSGTLYASAYEAKYGDLVLVTAKTDALEQLTKLVVDGVPSNAAKPSPGSYRDGVVDAGDDVGHDTDIAIGDQGTPFIVYRDLTNRTVKLAQGGDGNWTSHVVQAPQSDKEVLGRYGALTFVGGKPAVAYVALNVSDGSSGFQSELRWAVASSATPTQSADWTVSTVDTAPSSCAGLCASGEACIAGTSGSSCTATTSDCGACSSEEVCVNGSCVTPLTDDKIADIPVATGLWVSPVVVNDRPILVYHDRTKGNLMAATLEAGKWTKAVLKGASGDDVGAFCSAGLDKALALHVVYQDGDAQTLHYLQADSTTLAVKLSEVVDDGKRSDGLHPVGADAVLLVDDAGGVRVAYQDMQLTDLLLATRMSPGQWTPADGADPHLGRLLKGGSQGYGFFTDLGLEGNKIYGSTFYFDQQAIPKGALLFFAVP